MIPTAGTAERNERFCRLFEEYQPAFRRLAAVYAHGAADREDLVQEIAAAVWKALPSFRGESTERTWVYRIAHNIAIRNLARLRRRRSEEPLAEYFSGEVGSEAALIDRQRREALVAAIRELPLDERQLISLYLEGLSAAEMHEVTGISPGAVATRLTRIRQRLAEKVRHG